MVLLFRLIGFAGLAFGVYVVSIVAPRDALSNEGREISRVLVLGGSYSGTAWARLRSFADLTQSVQSTPFQASQAAVMVRARAFAIENAGTDRRDLRQTYDALIDSARRHLERHPLDGLVWFALGYHQLTVIGASPSAYAALQRSYVTVPREWWLMRMRNASLLPALNAFPLPLRLMTYDEFGLLLSQASIVEAANSYLVLDRATRDLVLPLIMSLEEVRREAFSVALRRTGDTEVIPLARHAAPRPWHRD